MGELKRLIQMYMGIFLMFSWNILSILLQREIAVLRISSQRAFPLGSLNEALLFSSYICTCEIRDREFSKKKVVQHSEARFLLIFLGLVNWIREAMALFYNFQFAMLMLVMFVLHRTKGCLSKQQAEGCHLRVVPNSFSCHLKTIATSPNFLIDKANVYAYFWGKKMVMT